MTSPGEPRPTQFEVVRRGGAPLRPIAPPAPVAPPTPQVAPPPEPPAAEAPTRPLGVSILAVLAMVQGALMVLTLLLLLLVASTEGGGAGGFFGALFLILAVFGLPLAAAGIVVGWGLWNGRKWAWVAALALSALMTLNAVGGFASVLLVDAPASPGGPAPASPGFLAVPLAFGLVPIAALVYLLQPGTRAYFDAAAASRPRTSAAADRTDTGMRLLLVAAAAAGLLAGSVAAAFPMRSLAGEADGASLASDAIVGFVAAALLAGVAVAGFAHASRKVTDWRPGAPIGVGIAAGVLLGLLLVSGAQEAARQPLLDGAATGDDGIRLLMATLGFAAFAALAVATFRADDATVAFARWGGAAALALGVAALGLAAFVTTNAGELQVQAAARERHETPGFGAALLALATLVALAMPRRRAR